MLDDEAPQIPARAVGRALAAEWLPMRPSAAPTTAVPGEAEPVPNDGDASEDAGPELPTVPQPIPHAVMLAGLLRASDPRNFPMAAVCPSDQVQAHAVPTVPTVLTAPIDPWIQGNIRLQAMEALHGFSPLQWLAVQAGCDTVARQADRLHGLGWTVLDCFGIDRDTPGAVHAWGLGMLVGHSDLSEITAALARITTRGGAKQTFYRRSRSWAVPVWECDHGKA